jgi:hypothetical protein
MLGTVGMSDVGPDVEARLRSMRKLLEAIPDSISERGVYMDMDEDAKLKLVEELTAIAKEYLDVVGAK